MDKTKTWTQTPLKSIDPALVRQLEYMAVSNGEKTVLIGFLDLSRFPTVTEVQALIEAESN